MSADTIYAVSSGQPPAAIAVMRISGPQAFAVATMVGGTLPPPRRAALRALRDAEGALLDRALVLVFPGPATATGEDLVEFHCHGGRAVVAAVERALAGHGLRRADPGEFTRRALTSGRIDLAQAEGLADLLEAETEAQRLAALDGVEGRVGRLIGGWARRVADLAAGVEATLDFADEADVDDAASIEKTIAAMGALAAEIAIVLSAPSVERLRDGYRVVIAGPPNAGKSTLLNLLADREAAIVSPIAGTTRDRVEAPVGRAGQAFLLVDTAGLTVTDDVVEMIGVDRARSAIDIADLVLWLGDDPPPRSGAIWVEPRVDLPGRGGREAGQDIAIAQGDHVGIDMLWRLIGERSGGRSSTMTHPALRERQRACCAAARAALEACTSHDALIVAEHLASAHRAFASALGIDATETMLDHLFGRFCIGK